MSDETIKITKMVLEKLCYDEWSFAAIGRHNFAWVRAGLLELGISPEHIKVAKPALKALIKFAHGKKLKERLKPYAKSLTQFQKLVDNAKRVCSYCVSSVMGHCLHKKPRGWKCKYFLCYYGGVSGCGGEAKQTRFHKWESCPRFPKCITEKGVPKRG